MTRTARKRVRAALAVAFVSSVIAATAAGCGSSDGVVGGDCASGYTQCGLACFDLAVSASNCGTCGHACAHGVACKSGKCAGTEADGAPLEDGAIDYDGNDLLLDGQFCDVSDPAHPVCRPSGGDSSEGGSSSGGDGTVPDSSDSSTSSGSDGGDTGSSSSSGGDDGSMSSTDGNTPLPDGETREPDGAITLSDGAIVTQDACTPPFDSPANCGSCGVTCSGANPVCALVDGSYACAPACTPPLTQCEGRCVNLARDPNNCGKCGDVCASQYCYLATCQGTIPGNAIIIGHDFATAKSTDQETKLLVNSVFYNPPTVRMLSFEHYVSTTTIANAKALLTAAETANHYTLTLTVTSDDTLISKGGLTVANEDAVIIWDQPNAPAGTMGALGSAWAANLATFAQQGGLIIVLDGAQGVAQMPEFLTNSAVLAVTSHTVVTAGSEADVPLAGLSIARGMTTEYGVDSNTASFTTSEAASPTTLFVANVNGQPTQLLAVQKITN